MPYPAGQEPLLNNTRLPLKLEDSGQYTFFPGYTEGVRNGMGLLVQAGLPRVEWTWAYVTKPDFATLVSLVGPGNYSVTFSGTNAARLWDDRMSILRSYTSCVVDRPVAESYGNGLFMNVILRISQLK